MDWDTLDLRRLDFVAGNYSELGALRLVPLGLLAVLMALFAGDLVRLSAYWESVVGVWALQAAVAGFWLTALWYRNNYGMTLEAWPGSEREARRWALAWAGASAMAVPAVADLGTGAELAGCLAGAALMAWIFVYWRRTGRIRPQGYALMALLAIGGLLRQEVPPSLSEHGYTAWMLALFGVALVSIGIVEHRRLAGEAKPLEDVDDGE